MNKTLPIFLLVVFLVSCKNNIAVTEKEVNSVQKVLNFYNGMCERHKGTETKDGETKTFFELEMSGSPLLENSVKNLDAHSGNIAYLFYSNLEEEKSNYNQVRVTIKLQNGSSAEYAYSDKEIEEIENLMPKVKNVSTLIKQKNHEALTKLFDPSVGLEEHSITEIFDNLESQYGIVKQSQFQGFEFGDTENFGQVVRVFNAQARERLALSFIYVFSRSSQQLITIEID